MKKIYALLVVLLITVSIYGQIQKDTIEYKQITLAGLKDWRIQEDNEDGLIYFQEEKYTSKMQALRTYTKEGWIVVAMPEVNVYLIKRKRSITSK